MTRSEYQELVEFLGSRFGKIDGRFDAVDRRFDAVEERLTRVEVLGEEDRHRTRFLAEALSSLNEKVDNLREDMVDEFRAVRTEMVLGFGILRAEMREGFDGLGSRVTRLEGFDA